MNAWQRFSQSVSDPFEMIVGSIKSARGDPQAWEASIRRFEAQDRRQAPPPDMIVFTGSSSFTLWSTLAQDMAPLPVLNRGFGGARMQDVVHHSPAPASRAGVRLLQLQVQVSVYFFKSLPRRALLLDRAYFRHIIFL